MEFMAVVGMLVVFSLALGLLPFAKDAVGERSPGVGKWVYRALQALVVLYLLWIVVGWVQSSDWLRVGLLATIALVGVVSRLVEWPSQERRNPTQKLDL